MNIIYNVVGWLSVVAGVATFFIIASDIQVILAFVLILGGLNLVKGNKQ